MINRAMNYALAEARHWIGATSPNPPVGAAALDAQGNLLAVAAHQRAGQLHAEPSVIALCRQKGCADQIHTLVVTLEPCNHTGLTPPCTETIIAARIPHVVVGTVDPNPKVSGSGIERLRIAGIQVSVGCEEQACRWLAHAFINKQVTGRPWLTVKRAYRSNGSMIPPKGQTTFTSSSSLNLAHRLRKKADAILTGSGTILADNPALTVRHVRDHTDKIRRLAILDRRRRVPVSYLESARKRGFLPAVYDSLEEAIHELGGYGVQDILVEAGPSLSASCLPYANLHIDITQGNPDRVDCCVHQPCACNLMPETFNLEDILPL